MSSRVILQRVVLCFICAFIFLGPLPLFGRAGPKHFGSPRKAALDQRFEGYVFLDAEGQPLPFQTDEAIERFLADAEVVSASKIPVGVSDPQRLLLAKDGLRANAVFKDIDREEKKVRDGSKFYLTWHDWYAYDIAAYRLDRLLGLDRVPPVIEREVQRNPGSVQIWLEGVITDAVRREEGYKPPSIGRFNQQKEIKDVFDNLVANRDSNLGNTLIDGNWRLWFIDCSRCFGTSPDLLYPDAINQCERSLWNALRSLDRSRVSERLSPYLSAREIDALFTRRDKIVDRLQTLIDEFGEIHILFDTIEANATAPWANE
jgi:hypothetical protein